MAAAIPSLVSFGLSKLGSKKAKKVAKRASSTVPENIRTGRSSFNTKTGVFDIDPSIRKGLDDFSTNIRGLVDPANEAFDTASSGIRDLQGRSTDIRSDFEGNQSDFRERQLASTLESQAIRKGELDRSLDRRDVFGSFGEQAKDSLSATQLRERRFAEAEIENQRLNTLGDFLKIDADLLKTGLTTEIGRTNLLATLEKSLRGVATEQFEQELALFKVPFSKGQAGDIAAARIEGNAAGIEAQAGAELAGDIFNSFDGGGGSASTPHFTNVDTTASIFATGR